MPYAVLEQKLKMVSEDDFDFVSQFLDMVLANRRNRNAENAQYSAMLDRSFEQLEKGEVVVKSMDELRALERS